MRGMFTEDNLVRCCVCNAPTDGRFIIGDNHSGNGKYYCHSDYEREMEKLTKADFQRQQDTEQFKKFVTIV